MSRRAPYQRSEAWHEERRTGYGASDAPILIEGSEAEWAQLHGEKLGLLPPREASERMALGSRLEDVIGEMAAERLGERLYRVNRIIRHPEIPYVFASLDRRRKGGRPVELKRWGFKGDAWGPEGSDIIPSRILYQIQQQAAVTGADAIDLFVLFPDRLEQFAIGRDQSMIDEILGLEQAAWAYVERGDLPPWPGWQPRRIILGPDEIIADAVIQEAADRHQEAAELEKFAKASLAEAKDRLRALLADTGAARGSTTDGRRLTISHRYTEPKPVVAWDLVAKAYRKQIEDLDSALGAGEPRLDLDAIESMFTTTPEPTRPLRVSIGKEQAA